MTAQASMPAGKIKVVLADDARHLLEMEKTFFHEREYEVFLAQNGCEAYNLVKTVQPAIVFLDQFMPLLNGEECCRLIKSDLRLRDTRVVLVSREEEQQLQRCRDANCDLVIVKPVRRREFIMAVHELVGHSPRVPVRRPVSVAAELRDDVQSFDAVWTVNLSEGGVFLGLDMELPVSGQYTLTLKLDTDRTLTVPIRIAWTNFRTAPRNQELPPGIGLQFLGLDDEARKALRTFLRGHSGEECDLPESPDNKGSMFVELPMLVGKREGRPGD